jgi:hypothetical protein
LSPRNRRSESGRIQDSACDVGWNDERTDPFRLKAFDIPDDASVTWLAAQLTGIPL